MLPQVNAHDFDTCESCIKGKMTRKSFSQIGLLQIYLK